MKIYHKLIVLLILTALFSTSLTSLIFLNRQNKNIKDSQRERLETVVSTAKKMMEEAEIADDSLMLVDYANYLSRMTEISAVEIKVKKLPWKKIRGRGNGGAPLFSEISSKNHKIKIAFSSRYLEEELKKEKKKLTGNAMYTGGAASVIASLIALLLGVKISKKFKFLEKQADRLGAGEFEAAPGIEGGDEIAELSRKISEAAGKLRELEEMKKEFISSATHELKSPLGAIESYINIFTKNRKALSEEEFRNLENIKRNIKRLSSFITGMLNLSKIEKGRMELILKEDSPFEVAKDSYDFFRPKAEEAGIAFGFEGVPGGKKLRIDRELLTHVVSNLISNALKFTPAGGEVKIKTFFKGETFRLEIRDTGPGIDKKDAEKLFIPFSRLKSEIKTEGTGLGLALSKKIVELHGGKIGVLSEKGRGSLFFFELNAVENQGLEVRGERSEL